MDWVVGKVVFPPCATPPAPPPYWPPPRPFVTEADLKRAMADLWLPNDFPCGWDERDAKV